MSRHMPADPTPKFQCPVTHYRHRLLSGSIGETSECLPEWLRISTSNALGSKSSETGGRSLCLDWRESRRDSKLLRSVQRRHSCVEVETRCNLREALTSGTTHLSVFIDVKLCE